MKKVVDWYLIFLASFLRLARTTSNEYPEVRAAAMVSTAEAANVITILILLTDYIGPVLTDIGIFPVVIIFFAVMSIHHYIFSNNARIRDIVYSDSGHNGSRLFAAIYVIGNFGIFIVLLFVLV